MRPSRTTEHAQNARVKSPTLSRHADSETIAIGIDEMDLVPPGLLHDFGFELDNDGRELAHPETNESVRQRIASVLREEDPRVAFAAN